MAACRGEKLQVILIKNEKLKRKNCNEKEVYRDFK